MLYVYLSHSNRQVILPTAVKVSPDTYDGPLVSFVDTYGDVIATFLRADVALFSERNLGMALEQVEENDRTEQPC